MRTKTIKRAILITVRVNDEHSSDDNDAVAVGHVIERWLNHQPTVNPDRVDIGITRILLNRTDLERELELTRELLKDYQDNEGDTQCPTCGRFTINL